MDGPQPGGQDGAQRRGLFKVASGAVAERLQRKESRMGELTI